MVPFSAPDCLPRLFDRDLGAAAEAAMKFTTSLSRKKVRIKGWHSCLSLLQDSDDLNQWEIASIFLCYF